jgi:hypothetical protein
VQTDERSWVEVVSAVTGLRFRPAPSNALSLRLEAVRQPLTRLIDGAPGLLLSPAAKVLRRGFNSTYRFKRIWAGGQAVRYLDLPDKNEASHVHDALQYALLGAGEYLDVRGRAARAPAGKPRYAVMEGPALPRPDRSELARLRAAGVSWKDLESRYRLSRTRLWEILTGRSRPRIAPGDRAADKDVGPTSSGLTQTGVPSLACSGSDRE